MLSTEGIILRTVKYGETSLIVDIFSREKGLIHGIVGGVRKNKSKMAASMFQLLQPVHLVMYYKGGEQLNRIKEVKPSIVLLHIHDHPIKRTLLIFFAELMQKSLKEKEANIKLFDFIFHQITSLEKNDVELSHWHILIMTKLTSYLGFYPRNDFGEQRTFFHLADGNFQSHFDPQSSIYPEESALFYQMLRQIEYNVPLAMNKKERKTIFEILMKYYRWHVPNFGQMKSPDILHSVLQ